MLFYTYNIKITVLTIRRLSFMSYSSCLTSCCASEKFARICEKVEVALANPLCENDTILSTATSIWAL